MGSNLDFENLPSLEVLKCAISDISSQYELIAKSNFFQSPAWPEGSSAPDYINCAIAIKSPKSPFELMKNLLEIEEKFGRVRDIANQWAPRTLDLDILDFDNFICNETQNSIHLHLPHPRISIRDFVFLPLEEVAPFWVHPVTGLVISDIKAQYLAKNSHFTAKRTQAY